MDSRKIRDPQTESSTLWDLIDKALVSRWIWLAVASVEAVLPLISINPHDSRQPVLSLASGVASSVVLVAVVWLAWAAFLRYLRGPWRMATCIPVVLFASLVRAFCIQWLMASCALTPLGVTLEFRIISSILMIGLTFTTGVIVSVGIDRHRARLDRLVAEQERLASLLAEADRDLRASRSEAIATVSAEIVAQFAQVEGSNASQAAESLERLANDVVRPLSHELAATLQLAEPPVLSDPQQHVDWTRVWGSVASVQALDPWGPAIAMLVITPSSMIVMGALPGLTMHILLAAAIAGGLVVVRSIAGGIASGRSTRLRFMAMYALLVLGCIPATVITALFPGPSTPLSELLWTVGMWPLVALFLAIVRATRLEQRRIDEQAVATSAQFRWWVSRIRLVGWWQHSTLARALHGTVQSTIHAAVQGLRSADLAGTAGPDLVEATLAGVRESLRAAVMPRDDATDVRTQLASVSSLWKLVASIEFRLSDDAERLLRTDPIGAEIAIDVITEAISNAIRHGGANNVAVTVAASSADVICVEVSDNGAGTSTSLVMTSQQNGLGSTQLDVCTIAWGRRFERRRHVLWFHLPSVATDSLTGFTAERTPKELASEKIAISR